MSVHLFIVSRYQPDLYTHLAREFAGEEDVQVIVDRRVGERRQPGQRRAVARGERRQAERRAPSEVTAQITSLGYAFVRIA